MNLVLGLSMTSSAVRWVLVEGTTGEGDTVDRGACDLTEAVEPEDLLDVVLANDLEGPIHAIGVTWTNESETVASGVLDALASRGFGNVIAVSELEAADALAAGVADIGGYDDLAVCICEPDATVVAVVRPAGVTVDRVARPADGADAAESVLALWQLDEWHPDAVFVLGSAEDLDAMMSGLAESTEAPVLSAAGADLALARGAALASARAVTGTAPAAPRLPSKVGALASVLAAAVVTFVVSLSVAVGLSLSHGTPSESPQAASAANPVDEPEGAAAASEPTEKKVSTPAEARKVVAQTIAVAVPPPPAAPVAEPVYDPPEYVPPAPEFTPPAPEAPAGPAPAYVPPPPPPAYVPPQQPAYVPPPKPRLRDRIIERIPIINRFHEPEYPYPR